jgi:hypothetical protein
LALALALGGTFENGTEARFYQQVQQIFENLTTV